MKKLTLLLTVIFLTLTITGQSHIFKNNKENIYKNGKWGRWVSCDSDIEIKTEPGGMGIYKISFYKHGRSHPEPVLPVVFAKGKEQPFQYIGEVGIDLLTITTNVKLSEMSKGYSGMITISLRGTITGFILSN